jgi:hypothetical protein
VVSINVAVANNTAVVKLVPYISEIHRGEGEGQQGRFWNILGTPSIIF